ncbi:MAG: hypothetical protein ACE5MG_01940 [Candidatus Methylomirabilales bacterium]
MDVQQQRILDYLVSYWREQFNLMPAVEICDTFQISPAETLKILEEMAQEGLVELHRRQAGPSHPGVLDRSVPEIFRGTFALPSRSVLKAQFDEAKQDLGAYKNLLYQGLSQDELFRFRPAILHHYRQNPNVEVQNNLIVTKRAALKRDDVHPVYVRYEWGTGPSGDRYIIANLWDLAELSQEEQALWASHELQELGETRA